MAESFWCPICEAWTASRDPEGRAETYCSRAGCGYEGPARKAPAIELAELRASLARAQKVVEAARDTIKSYGDDGVIDFGQLVRALASLDAATAKGNDE